MLRNELLNNFREIQNDNDFERGYKIILKKHTIVISDDVISLSVSNELTAREINDRSFESFDIILNDTKEYIGGITFDYYSKDISYGNVSYAIVERFQHKGYATRALRLLVKLLKNNNFKGDKDLYFWVSYYNEYSKKVILNNGGEILKGGEEADKSPYTLRIKI